MAANSLARRVAKFVLYPFLTESVYQWIQAAVKAWDIRSGSWSEPELQLVSAALRPGEAALDVGANFGLYTYHLARAAGPTGRVHAFEPVPFTCGTLRKVVRLLRLRNVTVNEVGCSDGPGKIMFEVPLAESGALATGVAYAQGRDDDRPGKETQVRWRAVKPVEGEVVALDEYLREERSIGLLKCDIEGAEPLAFRGARALLERHRPTVICEINPWYLEGFGLQLEGDLLAPLEALGYQLYFYHDGRLSPRRAAEVVEDNYVFIHPSRLDRFRAHLP